MALALTEPLTEGLPLGVEVPRKDWVRAGVDVASAVAAGLTLPAPVALPAFAVAVGAAPVPVSEALEVTQALAVASVERVAALLTLPEEEAESAADGVGEADTVRAPEGVGEE